MEEMRSDLAFKARQTETSAQTHQRLEAELAARRRELSSVQGLDKKITLEMRTLREKMQQCVHMLVRVLEPQVFTPCAQDDA